MVIVWHDIVAVVIIAIAQASLAMDVARMKVFRTLRQRLLFHAARAEHRRRKVIDCRVEEWQTTNPGVQLAPYESHYMYHGMTWRRVVYELMSCPYCLGHYIAALIVLIYRPRPITTQWWFLDFAVACFLIVTISTLFAGLIHRALDPMPAYADLDDSSLYADEE